MSHGPVVFLVVFKFELQLFLDLGRKVYFGDMSLNKKSMFISKFRFCNYSVA
jgi:hypothetical protein